jgi:hypothetical protein
MLHIKIKSNHTEKPASPYTCTDEEGTCSLNQQRPKNNLTDTKITNYSEAKIKLRIKPKRKQAP